jgi:putative DNA primase/helicase
MRRIHVKRLFDTGEVLYYDNKKKVYRFGGEQVIEAEMEKIGDYAVTGHVKKEVLKHIMDRTMVRRNQFDEDINILNVENGLLGIMMQELKPHDPNYLTLVKIPITYNPDAKCLAIEKFLGDVILDLHKLKEVLKFTGSILLRSSKYEKAMMVLGSGANGKSVFIKLLEALVRGEENCSDVSLQDIGEDKFAAARLYGKMLKTYADLRSARLKDTGNLKTIISGDTIEGQHKFKPRFNFRNYAKIIVSTST